MSTTYASPQVDVLVFTALPVEYLAVRAHILDVKDLELPSGTLVEWGRHPEAAASIGVIEVGMGNDRAAASTQEAVGTLNPKFLLFVGVAGGLKDVNLGDVVAASKVYGFEYGKQGAQFLPRPEVGTPSHRLVQRARSVARKSDWTRHLPDAHPSTPRAFVGPLAAGSKVVASTDSSVFTMLKTSYSDALAVEMEGLGFTLAAHMNRVESIVVRGISDLVDEKSVSDEGGWQAHASAAAAGFAIQMLGDIFPASGTAKPSTPAANQQGSQSQPATHNQCLGHLTRSYSDSVGAGLISPNGYRSTVLGPADSEASSLALTEIRRRVDTLRVDLDNYGGLPWPIDPYPGSREIRKPDRLGLIYPASSEGASQMVYWAAYVSGHFVNVETFDEDRRETLPHYVEGPFLSVQRCLMDVARPLVAAQRAARTSGSTLPWLVALHWNGLKDRQLAYYGHTRTHFNRRRFTSREGSWMESVHIGPDTDLVAASLQMLASFFWIFGWERGLEGTVEGELRELVAGRFPT